METKKLVYLCCLDKDKTKYWVLICPPTDEVQEFLMIRDAYLDSEHSPDDLKNLAVTSTAVWESKIYFLGGIFRPSQQDEDDHYYYGPPVYSNKLYSYDIDSAARSSLSPPSSLLYDQTLAPMQTPRNPSVSVAVSPGKIYVYGGTAYEYDQDLAVYAECYHIKNNKWSYLESTPPEEIRWMTSYAVYESTDGSTKCIYFRCADHRGIVSLDLATDQWSLLDPRSRITWAPFWNEGAFPVVDDVLYWFHAAVIYAYDFIKRQTFLLLDLRNKSPFNQFLNPDDPCCCNPHFDMVCRRPDIEPSFLFHVGDSRLCLICQDFRHSHVFHCSSFLIKKNQQQHITLELEHQQEISTPCTTRLNLALVECELSKEG